MNVVEIDPDIVDFEDIDIPKLKLTDDFSNSADIEEIIDSKPSVNFGSGIELLMNEKNKNEKKTSSNIDIDDIAQLENDFLLIFSYQHPKLI